MPKISELPLANKLKEEDYIPIVQDGVTKKVKGTHFVTEEEYSLDAFSPTIAANDKAMYKFGEGDTVDFSDSAYDGAYKSAILKGNTLVNLFSNKSCDFSQKRTPSYNLAQSSLKSNTTYTVICNVTSLDATGIRFRFKGGDNESFTYKTITEVGVHKFTMTPTATLVYFCPFILPEDFDNGRYAIIDDLILLEGDYTNIDIPYFEGMQSVRMPVLCTTGKNLCDNSKNFIGNINGVTGVFDELKASILSMPIKVNHKNYVGSRVVSSNSSVTFNQPTYRVYNSNMDYIGSSLSDLPETGGYVVLRCIKSDGSLFLDNELSLIEFQLEENMRITQYEPYKSNILSTPSDLVLGKVGNVEDTLDLLTGEIVSNFEPFVFNGSENWILQDDTLENTTRFILKSYAPNMVTNQNVGICNNFAWGNYDKDFPGIIVTKPSGHVYLRTQKMSVEELKIMLKNNPIHGLYNKEKVIKTVDLSGTPFGYKGGHIIKSSAEGSLLPKFEYEVAVSRGAQISQNTSTLIKHDEKITELLKKTAATYINQKAEIAYLLNMSSTLEEVQTIPFIEDDYVNDDCMVDSDMVMDDMEVEPGKEIIDNVDTLLINLIYDLIELNDTLGLSEKVELFRQSGLIDKHNYEIIKEKLNPTFKEEDYAGINQ